MHEEILALVIGRDEAEALVVVEPLHGSCCHLCFPPPGYVHCETRRVLLGNDCGSAGHFFAERLLGRSRGSLARAPVFCITSFGSLPYFWATVPHSAYF